MASKKVSASAPALPKHAEDGREVHALTSVDMEKYEGPADFIRDNNLRPHDVVAHARPVIEALLDLNNRDMVMTGRKSERARAVMFPSSCPLTTREHIEKYTGVSYERAYELSEQLGRAYHRQITLFRDLKKSRDQDLAVRYVGKVATAAKSAMGLVVRTLSKAQYIDKRIERLNASIDLFAEPLMKYWCEPEFLPTQDVEELTLEVFGTAVLVEAVPLGFEAMDEPDSIGMRFINACTSDRKHEVKSAGALKKKAESAALGIVRQFVGSRTRNADTLVVMIAFKKARLLPDKVKKDPMFERLHLLLRKMTPKGVNEKSDVIKTIDHLASKPNYADGFELFAILRKFLLDPTNDPNFIVSTNIRRCFKEFLEIGIECIEDCIGTHISDICWRKLPMLAYHLQQQNAKCANDLMKILRDLLRYFHSEQGQKEVIYKLYLAGKDFYMDLFKGGKLEEIAASEFPMVELIQQLCNLVEGVCFPQQSE